MKKEQLVILPTNKSPKPENVSISSSEQIVYVDDWFTTEGFREGYFSMLSMEDIIPDDNCWKGTESTMPFWRLGALKLYEHQSGNFKYLYPIIKNVINILEDDWESTLFVWPREDIVTDIVTSIGNDTHTTGSIEVIIDREQPNPTPRKYWGDRFSSSGGSGAFGFIISLLRLGALHLLLIFGSLLPSIDAITDKNFIYSTQNYREITSRLVTSDSVKVSTLRPKVYDIVRKVRRGDIQSASRVLRLGTDEETVYADQLMGDKIISLTPYVTFYRLWFSRRGFAAAVTETVTENGLKSIPEPYLIEVLEALLTDVEFLKLYLYHSFAEEDCDLNSITLVSGGITKEIFASIGKKMDVPVIDHGHSALSAPATERYNSTDIAAIAGRPDYNRLVDEGLDNHKEMILTGRLYYDNLVRYAEEKVDGYNRRIPEQMHEWDRPLTVATEPLRDEHRLEVIHQVFQVSAADGICIKLHPLESKEKYHDFLKCIETDIPYTIVYDGYELFDILSASSAVVTVSSNVGLEALALQTPATHIMDIPSNIQLYYQTLDFFEPFTSTTESVADDIDRLLRNGVDSSTVETVHDMYMIDGDTSNRVLNLYKDLDDEC